MKILKYLAVVLFASVASTASRAEPVTIDEYAAVIETANNYFNGLALGDQEMIAKAFDLEFGHLKYITTDQETGKESVRVLHFEEFAKQFTEPKAETWTGEIISVDIVDNHMAMVKMNFHTPRTHYIDYLVMYKREAGWRIISKTFVAHQKVK